MAWIENNHQRRCARPACNALAVVSFNFDGLRRVVWLGPLDRDPGHSAGDLCPEHADRFSVPRHWELRDLRDGASTPVTALAPSRPRSFAPAAATANTPLLARAFRAAIG
jgi:hypothetical protein